jgi:demethylmenaquinone methyltransferase / 2-methoxy-6-polyprenyl-1,4-benzoquinol methylase
LTDPNDVLPPPEEKRSYVQQMFTDIAPRYDLMNRLMTLGQDASGGARWSDLCELPRGGRLLDVATGTGDIGYEALKRDLSLDVVGVDLAREMMVRGRGKVANVSFPFATADALSLPFADNSFDAATSGFMMRNVSRHSRRLCRASACRQARRPRRLPGDHAAAHAGLRAALPLLLLQNRAAPRRHHQRQREAYTYLPHSALAFPRPAALADVMAAAGLRDVHYRLAMLGTVAIHWGTK